MKPRTFAFRGRAAIFCLLLPSLLAGSVFLAQAVQSAPGPEDRASSDEVSPAAARAAIDARYDEWARARVELDRETLDSIMTPDFYVLLYEKKISREKFLSDITRETEGVSLTRFDPEILTVRKSGDGWTAVITEKLEFSIPAPEGGSQKVCSFWVTRDGWRKDGDRWAVAFSEAIGHETWGPGIAPPIAGW